MKATLPLFVMVAACAPGLQQELNPQSFKEKLYKTTDAMVLDVRTPDEYSASHLRNAVNIDVKQETFLEKIGTFDKDIPFFIYCASGNRTRTASAMMKDLGFKKVYVLEGGIKAWQAEGLPVTKE